MMRTGEDTVTRKLLDNATKKKSLLCTRARRELVSLSQENGQVEGSIFFFVDTSTQYLCKVTIFCTQCGHRQDDPVRPYRTLFYGDLPC